jgi:hypothetical protein
MCVNPSMHQSDHICPGCGESVDPEDSDVVVAIEQRPVAGGDLPEVRQFMDGRELHCHEGHVPRHGLYRVMRNGGDAGTRLSTGD